MSLRWSVLIPLVLAASLSRAQPPSAAAGPITHTLTGYKVVREIPASWTIPRFKNIAKPDPAPEGQVWYVLTGKATNGSAKQRSVSSLTYRLRDAQGRQYEPDLKKALYQPEGTELTYLAVAPGASKDWVAFFLVPANAAGLVLQANDLTFTGEHVAQLRVPDPAAGLAPAAAPQAAAPASHKAPAAAPAGTPAPNAAGAPRLTAPAFFKEFNTLNGAQAMTRYKHGLVVSGSVLLTIKEGNGSHHVWLDAGAPNYISLAFKDKGAAVVAKGIKKGDGVTARCELAGGIGRYIMVKDCEFE